MNKTTTTTKILKINIIIIIITRLTLIIFGEDDLEVKVKIIISKRNFLGLVSV